MKTSVMEAIQTDKVTFRTKDSMFPELRKKIWAYFEANELEQTGNTALLLKGVFFVLTYIAAYAVIMLQPPIWVALLLCVYMGWAAAGIGFNLMHDGSHGSFSEKNFVNRLAAYSINMLGGDALIWKNKHNFVHHTYTNIEGFDQDIAQMPVFRCNLHQKKRWLHRFQYIYCIPVYALSSMLWIFLLDFIKYFTGKVGKVSLSDMTIQDHLIFWFTKIFYVTAYMVVPAVIWGPGAAAIGFLTYHAVLGTTLSVVFQMAHMVEDVSFTDEHFEGNEISDEWFVHQLKTTANFATQSKIVGWYTGGLNFQVEHHLFPKISHIHYPALNKIVKQFCSEKNICYFEFKSFGSAFRSHIAHMKATGNAA
jgi:linoleoyl-CoA desaturase